jgi:hypothetical protein
MKGANEMEGLQKKTCDIARWKRSTLPWLLFIASATANASLIDYGTAEAITFRDCIAGVSGCDDTNLVQILYGGYPGSSSSVQDLTLSGYGTATGSVALSGTIGAPTLTASATREGLQNEPNGRSCSVK